jgi:hypothetical protein
MQISQEVNRCACRRRASAADCLSFLRHQQELVRSSSYIARSVPIMRFNSYYVAAREHSRWWWRATNSTVSVGGCTPAGRATYYSSGVLLAGRAPPSPTGQAFMQRFFFFSWELRFFSFVWFWFRRQQTAWLLVHRDLGLILQTNDATNGAVLIEHHLNHQESKTVAKHRYYESEVIGSNPHGSRRSGQDVQVILELRLPRVR